MTSKKRGLGRGLEALLAEDSVKEETLSSPTPADDRISTSAPQPADQEQDDRAAMVIALFKSLQKEQTILLEEAEALRQLIEQFEAVIRADLS